MDLNLKYTGNIIESSTKECERVPAEFLLKGRVYYGFIIGKRRIEFPYLFVSSEGKFPNAWNAEGIGKDYGWCIYAPLEEESDVRGYGLKVGARCIMT